MERHDRPRMDWEAIFHGSRRSIGTVIIGCEADFRSRTEISREDAAKLIRDLKDCLNLSYESEATIAAKVRVSEYALNGWFRGKSKPTFRSLLKVQAFLNRNRRPKEGWRRLVTYRSW